MESCRPIAFRESNRVVLFKEDIIETSEASFSEKASPAFLVILGENKNGERDLHNDFLLHFVEQINNETPVSYQSQVNRSRFAYLNDQPEYPGIYVSLRPIRGNGTRKENINLYPLFLLTGNSAETYILDHVLARVASRVVLLSNFKNMTVFSNLDDKSRPSKLGGLVHNFDVKTHLSTNAAYLEFEKSIKQNLKSTPVFLPTSYHQAPDLLAVFERAGSGLLGDDGKPRKVKNINVWLRTSGIYNSSPTFPGPRKKLDIIKNASLNESINSYYIDLHTIFGNIVCFPSNHQNELINLIQTVKQRQPFMAELNVNLDTKQAIDKIDAKIKAENESICGFELTLGHKGVKRLAGIYRKGCVQYLRRNSGEVTIKQFVEYQIDLHAYLAKILRRLMEYHSKINELLPGLCDQLQREINLIKEEVASKHEFHPDNPDCEVLIEMFNSSIQKYKSFVCENISSKNYLNVLEDEEQYAREVTVNLKHPLVQFNVKCMLSTWLIHTFHENFEKSGEKGNLQCKKLPRPMIQVGNGEACFKTRYPLTDSMVAATQPMKGLHDIRYMPINTKCSETVAVYITNCSKAYKYIFQPIESAFPHVSLDEKIINQPKEKYSSYVNDNSGKVPLADFLYNIKSKGTIECKILFKKILDNLQIKLHSEPQSTLILAVPSLLCLKARLKLLDVIKSLGFGKTFLVNETSLLAYSMLKTQYKLIGSIITVFVIRFNNFLRIEVFRNKDSSSVEMIGFGCHTVDNFINETENGGEPFKYLLDSVINQLSSVEKSATKYFTVVSNNTHIANLYRDMLRKMETFEECSITLDALMKDALSSLKLTSIRTIIHDYMLPDANYVVQEHEPCNELDEVKIPPLNADMFSKLLKKCELVETKLEKVTRLQYKMILGTIENIREEVEQNGSNITSLENELNLLLLRNNISV